MIIEFVVNGYDAGPWLIENGLKQYEIIRKSRSVTVLSGTKYLAEITKRGIDASFIELRDKVWYEIMDALSNRPVEIKYVDDKMGPRTAKFYVSAPSASAKTVKGGITFFDGCSVSFEEV